LTHNIGSISLIIKLPLKPFIPCKTLKKDQEEKTEL